MILLLLQDADEELREYQTVVVDAAVVALEDAAVEDVAVSLVED